MMTEDYVSFETAKLLKDKGFDEFTFSNYDENGIAQFNEVETKVAKGYQRPTLQMAMKWLREVHNLYIEVSLSCDREDKNAKIFDASIFNIQNQRYKKLCNLQGYENACEAAIKYCFENLILNNFE